MILWGGRFSETTDALMRQFGDSIGFDQRLAAVDIRGSIAYAKALAKTELITAEEYQQLVTGLEQVHAEFEAESFAIQSDDEDIHTAVERRLAELVGPVAGKLHTGRSRNDQVATDLRLYLLDEIGTLRQALITLQETIVGKAEGHLGVIMPGYTHLQPAQPILFSHWLMAFFWKFQRDCERLDGAAEHTRVCPLGAGALAGNPFNIDRQALASELGFDAISQNSLDAVEDRDYVAEFLAWATLVQIHLSSLAETLIIWASHEFGFVELAEAYCTGSSIMPQKRNPDSLELIRAKSGRVLGHLVGLLCTLKGLPSGYNKDLQEDKEALFDVVDTLKLELPIAAGIIRTLKVNAAHMATVRDDTLLATDLADYLVTKGVPFRQCHQLVGQLVQRAEKLGVPLQNLRLPDYQAIHPAFGEDVHTLFDYQHSVQTRDTAGGTAPEAVRVQMKLARMLLRKDDGQIYSEEMKEV